MNIIINGEKFEWNLSIIMKDEVGRLAFQDTSWYKRLLKENPFKLRTIIKGMSCSYSHAHPEFIKPEGILYDKAVRVTDGTSFNIVDTSNA